MPCHAGPPGEALGEMWTRSFAGVSMRRKGEAEQSGLGLASSNTFHCLWGPGAGEVTEQVAGCTGPGGWSVCTWKPLSQGSAYLSLERAGRGDPRCRALE